MTTQDIIDHLKAGRPVTAKVVKEIVVELEFSRKQDAELKRLLAMQSDLDLQGYEHPRDELQELRDKLEAAGKNGRELSASCCPFLNNNGLYSDEYGHTRCHAKERVSELETENDWIKRRLVIAELVIRDFVQSLPLNRDWLNPTTERAANKLVREISEFAINGIEKNGLFSDVEKLRSQLAASEQRVKALEDALRAIADGRGMVPDKSTIYMNGRTPEVPAIFNKHDMQEIAKIVLEATCQSI